MLLGEQYFTMSSHEGSTLVSGTLATALEVKVKDFRFMPIVGKNPHNFLFSNPSRLATPPLQLLLFRTIFGEVTWKCNFQILLIAVTSDRQVSKL